MRSLLQYQINSATDNPAGPLAAMLALYEWAPSGNMWPKAAHTCIPSASASERIISATVLLPWCRKTCKGIS